MRTTVVNPTRRRRKKTATRRPSTKSSTTELRKLRTANARLRGTVKGMQMTNPTRRRRRKPTKRKRRRNAGIVPFVAATPARYAPNPLILNNPRRRRRSRKRNPKLTLKSVGWGLFESGSGAGIGAAANIFALNKIEDGFMRNGLRVAAAVLASMIPNRGIGAASAGALLYPVFQEVGLMVLQPTDADLDVLAADLEDILEEIDPDGDEEYDEDGNLIEDNYN